MELGHYSIEELLLTAIKSETEANKIYLTLAKHIKNGLLQDKFVFLAKEEEKHKAFIEEMYQNHFPGKKIVLPKKTLVPLPEIEGINENEPISKILLKAMEAEKAANDFYKSLASRFEEGSKINNTLLYFADMEMGHYKLLENEKESIERFEEADVYWPMVHVGP